MGWDTEWNTDWSINRPQYGGRDMLDRLKEGSAKSDRKVVLLMHDYAFRPSGYSDNDFDFNQLDEFIFLAIQEGYKFSTLDNYLLDDPYTKTVSV